MFDGGNSTPFTMPVTPAGMSGGMGGWGNDWIALAILALIFGDGWGMGGMGGMGMFLPFMFMNGGWGGFGNNGSSNGGSVMDAYVLNSDFATLQRQLDSGFSGVTAGINQVNQGLCNGFYQEAQLVNGVQMQIANEARTTDNAICNLGNSMMQGFNQSNVTALQNANALQSQLADCCCENRAAIAQVRYDMATQACDTRNTIQNTTRDIIDNNNANTRSILDFLVQDKISTLQSENQSLKLAASQAAQNNYLISELKPCPQPAYITCNPFTGQYGGYGYGYNNGCGCGNNSGCGCC